MYVIKGRPPHIEKKKKAFNEAADRSTDADVYEAANVVRNMPTGMPEANILYKGGDFQRL